ncbi:hypothetical protein WA158_007777 [Blastocystis sp. Blastoise]
MSYLKKALIVGGAAFTGLMGYELYAHREYASFERPIWRKIRPKKAKPENQELFPIRVARYLTIKTVSAVEYIGLEKLNTTKIYHKEKLQQYFNRPNNVGLVTVSNHQTTLDDPALICPLVRPVHFTQLQNVRWGTCSEEYCYKNSLFASFFTAGKTLPVKRGGGINHISFLDIIEKVKAGQWVHIFPEGRTWQENNYPPRDENGCRVSASGRRAPPGRYLGPLKWGVGKLISDCDITPVVVPFYHRGMEDIYIYIMLYICYFLYKSIYENNCNKYALPQTGKTVYVVIGDAVKVDDIINHYKPLIRKEDDDEKRETLRYAMYKDVTDRIDVALEKLEHETFSIIKQNENTNGTQSSIPCSSNLLEDTDSTSNNNNNNSVPTVIQMEETESIQKE